MNHEAQRKNAMVYRIREFGHLLVKPPPVDIMAAWTEYFRALKHLTTEEQQLFLESVKIQQRMTCCFNDDG